MNTIHLYDADWTTADVHNLLRCLQVSHLLCLVISKATKLRYAPISDSPAHRPSVNVISTMIEASLGIDALLGLLTHIHVHDIKFYNNCKVHGMNHCPPTPQV